MGDRNRGACCQHDDGDSSVKLLDQRLHNAGANPGVVLSGHLPIGETLAGLNIPTLADDVPTHRPMIISFSVFSI